LCQLCPSKCASWPKSPSTYTLSAAEPHTTAALRAGQVRPGPSRRILTAAGGETAASRTPGRRIDAGRSA
jgi:hypothetical protein